jgi:hypothetical protein
VVEAALTQARRGRRLLVVWGLAAALAMVIGTIQYVDHRRAVSATGGHADDRRLLPVPTEQLGALEIADAGRLHRFERDAAGTWFYHGVHAATEAAHTHASDPTLAASIERAVEAFGRTRIERDFALERNGAAYGVASPEVVVLVYGARQSQPLAQYAVGHVAPDAVSRYVLVVGQPVVATIPNYQIDNLLALVRTASAAVVPTTATPPAMAPTTTTAPAIAPTRTAPTATRPVVPAPAAPIGRQ